MEARRGGRSNVSGLLIVSIVKDLIPHAVETTSQAFMVFMVFMVIMVLLVTSKAFVTTTSATKVFGS